MFAFLCWFLLKKVHLTFTSSHMICADWCTVMNSLQFLKNSFVVILFHYDGIVDEWNEEWGGRVLHVSAMNQTKWYDYWIKYAVTQLCFAFPLWIGIYMSDIFAHGHRWFAKRFLHPDIVAEYEYIFLWDEDLGVEKFHPRRCI